MASRHQTVQTLATPDSKLMSRKLRKVSNVKLPYLMKCLILFCFVWVTIVFVSLPRGITIVDSVSQDLNIDGNRLSQLLETNRSLIIKAIEYVFAGKSLPENTGRERSHKGYWKEIMPDPRNDTTLPGYGGQPVVINPDNLSARDRKLYDEGLKIHGGFNVFASDLIPLRRKLTNIVDEECLARQYNTMDLPTTGIVIIFHNEAWSILLRTVHSILDNTPQHLLTEIVLVDDASTLSHLGRALDDYIGMLKKVKIIRNRERIGLIRARMMGCESVTGKVCAFLDSHCEVNEVWLEPLLDRIRENDNILAVPSTDGIDHRTLAYIKIQARDMMRGGIDLDMYFTWIPQSKADNQRRGSVFNPIWSPTHLGCCFAISKATFVRLGMYDPGLKIWGCENIELSFKVWMCGGRVEIIPCSRVAHMFRTFMPYSWETNDEDTLAKNCLRVSEVWMDEYKTLYHERIYNRHTEMDYGDITDRKALRERLQCKPFDWFVKHVYPELYLPIGGHATGHIRNSAVQDRCIHTAVHLSDFNQQVHTESCHHRALIQHFTLTKEFTIRRDDGCLDYNGNDLLVVRHCNDVASSPGWKYTEDNSIYHIQSGKCIELSSDNRKLNVVPCTNSEKQKWLWERRAVTLEKH